MAPFPHPTPSAARMPTDGHPPRVGLGRYAGRPAAGSRPGPAATGILWALSALFVALGPAPVHADPLPATVIYGVASDNDIYSFDPATGQIVDTISTASLGLSGSLANGFALNRERAQVYFLSTDKNLYYWDRPSGGLGLLATAAQLGIDTLPIPRNATFFADRYWYIDSGANNLLMSASIAYGPGGLPTGVTLETPLTITGVTGSLNPNDLAYDPDVGLLYGSDFSGATNTFFQIDMSSLSGDRPYTALYTQPGVGVQLAFDKDFSTLYGADYETGQWYTIDTVAAGTFNAISGAVTPAEYRMRDLAGGLAAVPEPGTLALGGSGIACAAAGLWRSRHRRRSSRAASRG